MKKVYLLAVVMVMMLIFTFAGTAIASPVSDNLFAGSEDPDEPLNRGDFAAQLVEASGMESDLSPVDLLLKREIIVGYPDGELYLDRKVNRAEAVTLTARVLGLSDNVPPMEEEEKFIDTDHWAYNFYSWFGFLGLVEGDPCEILTRDQGEAFLKRVFSTDSTALEIMEDTQKQFKDIKTLSLKSTININMIPRPGMEDVEEIPEFASEMSVSQKIVFPNKIKQVSTVLVDDPQEGMQEITLEMYMIDGKMYHQIPDMETGETTWVLFPEGLLPDMEELIEQQMQTDIIPPGMEDSLYYKLLGKETINGEEVYKISQYGSIDDMEMFMTTILEQFGDASAMQHLLAMSFSMLESMSIWGVEYVGVEDGLSKSSIVAFVITYAPEFAGSPNPLEALQMQMRIDEIKYNEDISIELPEEALDAEELELPEMPEDMPMPEEVPEEMPEEVPEETFDLEIQ